MLYFDTLSLHVDTLYLRGQNNVALTWNMQPRYLIDQTGNLILVFYSVKYNPVHNIWEFYKVLVQFPFTTSKTELDIYFICTNFRAAKENFFRLC